MPQRFGCRSCGRTAPQRFHSVRLQLAVRGPGGRRRRSKHAPTCGPPGLGDTGCMVSSDSPQGPTAKRALRMSTPIILVLAFLVPGCAGHSIDCITGNSTKDCAPGTIGRQQMVQDQQGEETTAAIDDARCRSMAPFNSPEYLACRNHAAEVRRSTQAR